MRFLRRLRARFLDIRIELNRTVVDFFDSRYKTLIRRKRNLEKRGTPAPVTKKKG